ncbi:hypothetical protein F5878DRAFT_612986 [Lentinula raphanica]|uniref:GmrSD restriction endonucleases N-terminal domain-containing protein n=1 Tax=Lentinula raphanica TaxID=153919 RepID=A0AA38UGP1_9AGAR|nr:hypothetical protein F5878DRAFT_612986 [Lentinula raphanica]
MSSDSELTDLVYDVDHAGSDNETTSHRSNLDSIRKSTESDYRFTQVLKPPRATTYTVLDLYQQIHNSGIDLSPEYQRDVVWAKEKQICLIDSMCRNYYIPPILFAVSIDDNGTEHRTCIDGKQRLTSIQLFMDGLIPHRDTISGQRYWYKITNSPGDTKTKELLPERWRAMFASKQVVCVEYTGLTDARERDIFERVQQGVAMKPSEKLGAISTPHSRFIRKLLDRYVTDSTLGSIPWATSRGGDFRCFSHAVFCIGKWTSSPGDVKDHGSLADMEKWLGGPDEVSTNLKAQVEEVYDVFVRLATSTRYSAPFREYKKVSPAEMVFIPVLIFAHGVLPSEELRYSQRELSTAIFNMRHAVRENFHDVRMNHRVGAFLVDFIKKMGKKAGHALPAKMKRKRLYKEEEDKQSPYTDTSDKRKVMTPDTPTASFDELEMAESSSANTSAPKKRRQTSPANVDIDMNGSRNVSRRNIRPAAFQTHIHLSSNSIGPSTYAGDTGRGPLNRGVSMGSRDVIMG